MHLRPCTAAQIPEILAIFNDAILHSTALYDYEPRSIATVESWFAAKQEAAHPVLGLFADDGTLAGFASYGPFRAWPAYKYTVEHSIYLHPAHRGRGFGKQLLEALIAAATAREYHTMIGGIDSTNAASIRLHLDLGFTHCGTIREAGYKFGRWLDLAFYQLLLPTPAYPTEA